MNVSEPDYSINRPSIRRNIDRLRRLAAMPSIAQDTAASAAGLQTVLSMISELKDAVASCNAYAGGQEGDQTEDILEITQLQLVLAKMHKVNYPKPGDYPSRGTMREL